MIKLDVKVTNGPELQRLLEVLIDAKAMTVHLPSSHKYFEAKERLINGLGDLKWVKKLVQIDSDREPGAERLDSKVSGRTGLDSPGEPCSGNCAAR